MSRALISDVAPATSTNSMVEADQAERALVPVKWWAAIGGCFLTFELYLLTRWILSDNFHRVPSGPDPIPTYMIVTARVFEVIGTGTLIFMLGFFVIRPWRR